MQEKDVRKAIKMCLVKVPKVKFLKIHFQNSVLVALLLCICFYNLDYLFFFFFLLGLRIKKSRWWPHQAKCFTTYLKTPTDSQLLTATALADKEYVLVEAAGKGDIYSNANFQYQ